jgi:hypothetical protein
MQTVWVWGPTGFMPPKFINSKKLSSQDMKWILQNSQVLFKKNGRASLEALPFLKFRFVGIFFKHANSTNPCIWFVPQELF